MSLPGVALALVRALPDEPAVLLSRTVVVLYLALRSDYRREIGHNFRIIMKKESRWFWLENGWRVGRNLALMAKVGGRRADALVDRATVHGENLTQLMLERELHATMGSFHFGLWEYLPRIFSRGNRKVTLAVGEQQDASLAGQLSVLRRSEGVSIAKGIKQAIRASRGPSTIGFMLDNTTQGVQSSVECDGISLRLPRIGFRLAAREGSGLAPAFARLDRGRLRVDVYPVGDERAAARALLEQVRKYPDEWVWWGKAGAISR